ncbi:MAG: nicotinate (nicotinamide) nucleotide adenylyltransferase [Gemmatimonadetes bacterium]|nr:MAG: nicotinate (nicotinamide) nucleotide adenylyltransferase [Gemmatimonadota bacterium]
MRIGVFGGTFDPPHVGHLLLAADARDALNLDRLIFVPASAQPFKVETPAVASARDRLEMIRLVVADDANYQVDETEIDRKGLSYTVDTLEHLSARYPGAQIFLLVGQDALESLGQWKNPQGLVQVLRPRVSSPFRRGASTFRPRRSVTGSAQENRSRDSCPKASSGSSTRAGSIVGGGPYRLRKISKWR